MRFYVNDLSLEGQFASSDAFLHTLRVLLNARDQSALMRNSVFCSSALGERPATASHSFREIVQRSEDKTLRQRVLRWVTSSGPFWEYDAECVEDNLFHYAGQDVTLQGLGEAARRRIAGTQDAAFSFVGSPHGCDEETLVVLQGLPESPVADVSVPNFCDMDRMIGEAHARLPEPQSWEQMLERVDAIFGGLRLSRDIAKILRPHPFNQNVCRRTLELLDVLDQLVRGRDETGRFTEGSQHLIATRFSGSEARFTDESPTNKERFRKEMTFRDPETAGTTLFCPFHGKINTPTYRIHFEWPLLPSREKLFVAYIGPKITR